MTTTAAGAERADLCDLFDEVGPDAPTLCGEWTTRDLAAHLIVRERRPDGTLGIVVKPFASYGERVRADEAERAWPELIERVRSGPPRWSPARLGPVDRVANTVEFFVHHEDVRRARDNFTPRSLRPDLIADLSSAMARMAKLLVRHSPVGLTLVPTDVAGEPGPIVAHEAEPMVTVSGPVGELTLFVYGRQAVAKVALDGPDDAVAAARTARFGI